jgi:small GTP-binding protein
MSRQNSILSPVALHMLSWHTGTISSMAWSPDGRVLASGSDNKTIRLWDGQTRQLLHTLEGHTGTIYSVAWSPDGFLFVSKSDDGTVRLWSTRPWQTVEILEKVGSSALGSLAFHPHASALMTLVEGDTAVRVWNVDVAALLATAPVTSTVQYTTARIALVGDGGVGKTGLGYRLAEGRFQVTESTHGQQFWVVEELGKVRGDGTLCEAILWDFAGQPNFRPIHALFLDDVDLALVLFDPSRPDTLTGVDYWLKNLSYNQHSCRTILVAARTDVSQVSLSSAELHAFCRERKISGGFIATSAKLNEGIDILLDLIRQQIEWDIKSTTVTTHTFKRIKDYVLALKANADRDHVLVSPAQLRQQLEITDPGWRFSNEELMGAVGHLQNHGYVTILRRSSAEEYILLAPDLLINLAASFLLKAQANEKGLGTLEEVRVLRNEYTFPEVERLSEKERDILLNAVTELFLNRNICFRESVDGQTFLIFPSLIIERPPRMIEDAALIVYRKAKRFSSVKRMEPRCLCRK